MPQRILLLYKSFRLNMWYVDKYLHWIIDKLSRSVDGCFSLDSKFTKRGEFCDDGRVIKKNKIRFDNRGMKWAIYVQFAWLEKMGLKGGDQRKWQNHTKIIQITHFLEIIKSFFQNWWRVKCWRMQIKQKDVFTTQWLYMKQ